MKINLDILYREKLWKNLKFITKNYCKKIITHTLSQFKFFDKIEEVEICILLTNSEEIKQLNRNFRSKNNDTNVLSFPYSNIKIEDLGLNNLKSTIELGDIAFSYDKMIQESKNFSISLENHFTHLLIHSILHLIGFDHQNDNEEKIMQSYEISVLKFFSIPSPY